MMRYGQERRCGIGRLSLYLKPTAPLKLSLTNSSCQMMDESIQNAAGSQTAVMITTFPALLSILSAF